ncbi:MAG: DUF960 domain-containing protein [Lachnospiraceae bacterium]|nr:DUF960 domain-containing protein [Ruminococcus sp.]MCM1275358.1 DUF960 domain-containing protein [Lachnospiraceae bacterium]
MSNFDSEQRYITGGINESVPTELVLFMWSAINKLKNTRKLDYLQVFDLKAKGKIQVIEHRQEVPPYKKTYNVLRENPITARIFVIDDGDHETMLLADEY